jgi:hyperosmotically inducible protein
MRVDRKFLVLGVTLAATMSVLIAGCGNRQGELPKPPASTTIGTEIDDTVVTTKVKSALFADPDIKSFDLTVVTRKGEVQLSGFVDSQAQIDQAIAIAHKMDGVKSVGNEMSIKK